MKIKQSNSFLDPSLVLYLPLHRLDGEAFSSQDAFGRQCTVTGALWTPRGRSFDIVDDSINTGFSQILNEFSLIIWYQPLGLADAVQPWNSAILDKSTGNTGWFLEYANQTIPSFALGNGIGFNGTSASPDVIGTFRCVGLSCVSGRQVVYDNGCPGAYTAFAYSPDASVLRISTRNFKPLKVIRELALFNRILTAAEFQNYYITTKGL